MSRFVIQRGALSSTLPPCRHTRHSIWPFYSPVCKRPELAGKQAISLRDVYKGNVFWMCRALRIDKLGKGCKNLMWNVGLKLRDPSVKTPFGSSTLCFPSSIHEYHLNRKHFRANRTHNIYCERRPCCAVHIFVKFVFLKGP